MRITRMCFFCCLPILLLIALFPSEVLRIYTDNTDLIGDAVPSLWVMLSSYIFFIPAMIWFTIVSGTGNTRQAFMLDLAALSVYVVYVLYVAIWLKCRCCGMLDFRSYICRFYAVILFFVFEKVRLAREAIIKWCPNC